MKIKLSISKHFLDALVRLNKKAQKQTREFLRKFQENPESGAIHLEKIDSFKDPNLRSARVSGDIRAIIHVPDSGILYHVLWVDHHDDAYRWAADKTFEWNRQTQSFQYYETPEIEKSEPGEEAGHDADTGLEAFGQADDGVEFSRSETAKFKDRSNVTVIGNLSDEQISALGVPGILLPSIREIAGMDDLQKIEPYLPEQTFEYLFYLLDGVPYQEIIDEIEQGKAGEILETEHPEASLNYQREYKVITDDKDLEEVLSDSFEAWRVFLHPTQRSLASNDFNGAVKVTGGAGTGKTVAAIHRAKKLSQSEDCSMDKPVLFTTFTKALSRNLGELLSKIGANTDKIQLENIHGFIVNQAKRLGWIESGHQIIDFTHSDKKDRLWDEVVEKQLSEYDTGFLKEEYDRIIQFFDIREEHDYLRVARRGRKERLSRPERKKVWKLIESYQKLRREKKLFELADLANELAAHYRASEQKAFSHIIADEIQDFSNVELRLIRLMVEEKENDLYLTGDPFQTIYKKRINFSECGINVRGRRSRRLKINYRTTEEIRRYAMEAISNKEYDDFDGGRELDAGYVSLLNGQDPVYKTFKTRSEEFEFIHEHIKPSLEEYNQEAFEMKSICVACRTRDGVKELQKYFHQNKIPYANIADEARQGNVNGVQLSTLHNMKGLEFQKVILADVNSQTIPLRPYGFEGWSEEDKKEHEKRERALIYVAMTRAIRELVITGTGNKTKLI